MNFSNENSKMALLEVDAQKVETFYEHFKAVTNYVDRDKFDDLMSSFSHFDLKSVIFLLLDFMNLNTYMYLIKKKREELYLFIKDMFYEKNISPNVLIDILMTMKKFQDLKKLKICKHQLSDFQEHSHIPHVWKFLYSLCAEVDHGEVKLINSHFFRNPEETESLEEVICRLLMSRKLGEENLQDLSDAFRLINRTDLVDELKKNHVNLSQPCNKVSSEVESYYIRQPAVNNPCGLAVIINEENFENAEITSRHELSVRRGSNIDRDKLQEMWTGFGFQTEVYNNLKSFQIIELFKKICGGNQDYDIFVACLLSHGQFGIIYGSDGLEVEISDLSDMIANTCQTFCGKPKLFFVQACQEYESQESSSNGIVKTKWKNRHPEKGPPFDVYEAFSTVPGHVSYRHPCSGSVFISALVEELSNYGDKEEIDVIMKRVKQKVSPVKQMPITNSTLRKHVFLKRMRGACENK